MDNVYIYALVKNGQIVQGSPHSRHREKVFLTVHEAKLAMEFLTPDEKKGVQIWQFCAKTQVL